MRLLIAFVVVLTMVVSTSAAPSAVDLIIVRSGMVDNARQALQMQMDKLRAEHPEIPASTWMKVDAEIQSTTIEQDMRQMWAQAFTPAELKDIATFLGTPTGKKFFTTMPSLMPRLAAVAGLAGFKAFQVLQTLHPDKFPKNAKQDAEVKKLFEAIKTGKAGG